MREEQVHVVVSRPRAGDLQEASALSERAARGELQGTPPGRSGARRCAALASGSIPDVGNLRAELRAHGWAGVILSGVPRAEHVGASSRGGSRGDGERRRRAAPAWRRRLG